jgi:hypothetical protein
MISRALDAGAPAAWVTADEVWCQSRPVRASRDISMPSTMPARPIVTSVTSLAKPLRESGVAADTPRSSSITATCDRAQPTHGTLGERVLQPRRLRVLKHLLPARLADVHDRRPAQMLRADLLLRLPLRPVPGQAHHDRLPSRGQPPLPASPAARPPRPAAPAAGPPRPGDRETPRSRYSAASRSPAAADRSRRASVAACNSAPTLSIAPESGVRLETVPTSGASAVAD